MSHFSPEIGESETKPENREKRWRIVLYNDNRHKFDDVVSWLTETTACKSEFAMEICHVCQDQGRAVCFQGEKFACHEIAALLRRQGLQVEVDDY